LVTVTCFLPGWAKVSKDFDSDYVKLMNVLYYNSESDSQRLSMFWTDGVKEINGTE